MKTTPVSILNTTMEVLAILCFVCCRSVPHTERTQLMLVSQSREKEFGEGAYAEYKTKYRLSENKVYQQTLKRCGSALAETADEDGIEWEFSVLETPVRNAFCLPGGKVAVYSGMMDEMHNEAELAFVVAHEMGHAIARHFGEQTSWQFLKTCCGLFSAEESPFNSDISGRLDFELEADRIGMVLMAKAGYEPEAAIQFWTRFGNAPSGRIGESLMHTHPRNAERIAAKENNMATAREEYAIAPNRKGFGVFFLK